MADRDGSPLDVPKKCEAWKQIYETSNSYYFNLRSFYDSQKCYFCCSNGHSIESCPQRLAVPQFFCPAIDADLFPRFMQLLNAREYYYLFFCYEKVFSSVPLKKIRIEYGKTRESGREGLKFDKKCITAVYNDLHISHFTSINKALWKILICSAKKVLFEDVTISRAEFYYILSPNIKILECKNLKFSTPIEIVAKIPNIELCNLEKVVLVDIRLSNEEFFYFLSPKITTLECLNLGLSTPIKFVDILTKIPDIVSLKIHLSDVKIGKSWRQKFQKYIKKEKCKNFKIDVKYCDFSVRKLANFMKAKCREDIQITIAITEYPHNGSDKLKDRMSTRFDALFCGCCRGNQKESLHLYVATTQSSEYIDTYTLKRNKFFHLPALFYTIERRLRN